MRRAPFIAAAVALVVLSVGFAGGLLAVERTPRQRIAALDVAAVVDASGDVAVTEEFAWDFDTATRRQILRTIPTDPAAGRPGTVPISEVAAASATASAEVSLEPTAGVEVVVIGSPDQRITGTHEYRLTYTLGSVVDGVAGDAVVELDLVGTLSDLPVNDVTASVEVPGPLVGGAGAVRASVGSPGSTTRLDVEVDSAVDGAVDGDVAASVVRLGPVDLAPNEGISVRIRYDAPVDPAPPVPGRVPTTLADEVLTDAGLATTALPPPALANPLGVLVVPVAIVASAWAGWSVVRRWGRDRRWGGSAVDAAFGPGARIPRGATGDDGTGGETGGGAGGAVVTVSESEANHLVTVAFAPPPGVAPGEGGALWRMRVGTDDRVATIVDLAVRGWLVVDDSRPAAPQLLWRGAGDPAALTDAERQLLMGLFGGGAQDLPGRGAAATVSLGTYSPAFAATWRQLGADLDPRSPARGWLRPGSGWRALAALAGGLAVAAVGALVCLVVAASRLPGTSVLGWLVVVPPALAVGAGLGCATTAGGMRARTPEGFAAWMGVEGFRRFIVGSDAEYSRHAAESGVLRPYVAWAVAFGEVERWERACVAAGVDPGEGWVAGGSGLSLAVAGLTSDTTRTATAPSSGGGGGGGFSGSVGGGAGGGGFSSR